MSTSSIAEETNKGVDSAPKEGKSSCPTAQVDYLDQEAATQMTCDVLCALSSSSPNRFSSANQICESSKCSNNEHDLDDEDQEFPLTGKRKTNKTCPKQLQLPMFLSKTYHMIDRCDPEIATWSESGDNFVVKNVEKFATSVLPLYFKHSNFSSFARQLNFYGFRKLRTDPILTSDVDPRTACYVRFYHEKFQKNKPELLHQIKRATKTDQQSKDDVESLKHEVSRLKDALSHTTAEYDRKLAELSYECNRRITAMNAEYDKLAALVQHALVSSRAEHAASAAAAAASHINSASVAPSPGQVPDLLHSLSQAAVSLQNHLRGPVPPASLNANGKRSASGDGIISEASRPRLI